MNKFLIINADDFGYSHSINKGIIEAVENGIVTSTSVMVDAIAADEAKDLTKYPDISIGLHFELKEVVNVEAELERQIEKFVAIVGRQPDHIDTHKRRTTDEGIKEVLEAYAKAHNIPVRNFNAKHIGSFGVNSSDASVAQLKRSIDEATDESNELMTHCGYADDYLREHSSYSEPREQELASICNPSIKQYIADKDLRLINWKQVL
ncbi:MAG: ChbG/HpnK family deacetylase [Candidatus Saccharimonas sp.]|nr:ChbG/HpnK family deacetylase [Candidatus Saccharimonas sp.]